MLVSLSMLKVCACFCAMTFDFMLFRVAFGRQHCIALSPSASPMAQSCAASFWTLVRTNERTTELTCNLHFWHSKKNSSHIWQKKVVYTSDLWKSHFVGQRLTCFALWSELLPKSQLSLNSSVCNPKYMILIEKLGHWKAWSSSVRTIQHWPGCLVSVMRCV